MAPDSATETFAAVKFLIDNWRWQGVPFYVRTGKRLPHQVTEVAIQFKRPPFLLFKDLDMHGGRVPANVLVLRIQPEEGISLIVEAKTPGADIDVQTVEMDFSYGTTLNELPFSAYETLLLDCMTGDQTLFNRDDQVELAWRVVDPILDAWRGSTARDVMVYEAGTWGPEAADTLVARTGTSGVGRERASRGRGVVATTDIEILRRRRGRGRARRRRCSPRPRRRTRWRAGSSPPP